MKLSNLIKEQSIGGTSMMFLNIPYLAAAWNSIYDTNFEEVNPMFPPNFDLADWITNFQLPTEAAAFSPTSLFLT